MSNLDKPSTSARVTGDAASSHGVAADRRAALKRLGRFAAITAPALTLMLAAGTKPAGAQSCSPCSSSRAFKIPEGAIDSAALLTSVRRMPVEPGAIRACDFQSAFAIGNGTEIHPMDAVGVCLGAIQALARRIGCLEAATA